jgi:predicted DNA-binding transcriptional regulator AlpA
VAGLGDRLEPARTVASPRAQEGPDVAALRSLAEHLEAAARIVRRLETRLATPRASSPYALVHHRHDDSRPPEALLDATTLGNLLGLDPRTVRRMGRSGRIPAPLAIGAALRWRRSDIDAWLASGAPH